MPIIVYVLQSESSGTVYIGQTNDLERRLSEHNDRTSRRTLYTKRNAGPWRVLYTERYADRSSAMKREKALKGGQGRAWIKRELLGLGGC
jgi:putative endonuclease